MSTTAMVPPLQPVSVMAEQEQQQIKLTDPTLDSSISVVDGTNNNTTTTTTTSTIKGEETNNIADMLQPPTITSTAKQAEVTVNTQSQTVITTPKNEGMNDSSNSVYKYLVVDSGPIIKQTGLNGLWKQATMFYTVPAVIHEIRDAKAREYLSMLPFTIQTQQPTAKSVKIISDFARKTGDYQSLSHVDIQVLALLYDLEYQACHGHMDHIRTTPKRTVGLGKITSLAAPKNESDTTTTNEQQSTQKTSVIIETKENNAILPVTIEPVHPKSMPTTSSDTVKYKPKTWAGLVSIEGSNTLDKISIDVVPSSLSLQPTEETNIAKRNSTLSFGSMNIRSPAAVSNPTSTNQMTNTDGQFSDAEGSDEDDEDYSVSSEDDDDSDNGENDDNDSVEKELMLDFPSLTAAAIVAHDDETNPEEVRKFLNLSLEERRQVLDERKAKSLQPISKSGKLYNPFTKYRGLMKPKQLQEKDSLKEPTHVSDEISTDAKVNNIHSRSDEQRENEHSSRIVGGVGFSGQDDNVDDDGQGWITCTDAITTLKASGMLDPTHNPSNGTNGAAAQQKKPTGPPLCQRAACATTDFAMQNVILQMNLELLSVDGMKVRKLKTWVTRCGACFKIYTSNEYKIGGRYSSKRLFCSHCGSDMMERIAASVESKTGRLRLHLSKKYKHNLRGTKFSLPKPGSGNKYEGDLLLREDQLLTGAWNLKVKKMSGVKAQAAAESIFGNDIASNVGCTTRQMSVDDIRVGFGRRNPNAAKGRERRGKKKKTTDKACGLRRY